MCTLIIGYKALPGIGLFVGANRDEFYARPSSSPRLWTEGAIPFCAPRDERAGGTWIGYNAAGLFVGITNRFGASNKPNARTRGQLVARALGYGTAEDAAGSILSLSARDYNGFHLVVLDSSSGFIVWHDGESLRSQELAPGVHILTERSFQGDRVEREHFIYEQGMGTPHVESLVALLTAHGDNRVDGTCLHVDEAGYGTRSSLIIRFDESWQLLDAQYADGHPCKNPFEDISPLFASMGLLSEAAKSP